MKAAVTCYLTPRLITKNVPIIHYADNPGVNRASASGRPGWPLSRLDDLQSAVGCHDKQTENKHPDHLRHRYLASVAILNLPENVLIGGGEGMGVIAGMSRIFPFYAFVSIVAVAMTPIPLLFFFEVI